MRVQTLAFGHHEDRTPTHGYAAHRHPKTATEGIGQRRRRWGSSWSPPKGPDDGPTKPCNFNFAALRAGCSALEGDCYLSPELHRGFSLNAPTELRECPGARAVMIILVWRAVRVPHE